MSHEAQIRKLQGVLETAEYEEERIAGITTAFTTLADSTSTEPAKKAAVVTLFGEVDAENAEESKTPELQNWLQQDESQKNMLDSLKGLVRENFKLLTADELGTSSTEDGADATFLFFNTPAPLATFAGEPVREWTVMTADVFGSPAPGAGQPS